MKAIKSILLLPLILVVCTSLSQCGREEVVEEQIAVAPCLEESSLVRSEFFENITGTVIKHIRKRNINGQERDLTFYYVNAPAAMETPIVPLGPCNLPSEVMEDGLKIKFTGHLFAPADPRIMLNVEAHRFEITKLSLQTEN